MKTYGDLFTGFGGATLGAMDAGLKPLWGVEYDPAIAAVANSNLGGHVVVASVLDCDPATFEPVDVMHASPPCPNFSVAKSGGKETDLDISLARKVAEFVTVLTPRIFTLENVWAYRQSDSWRIIEDALYGAGYWLHMEHINCANLGVPQTRKRMIVRAVRGGWVPTLPQPEPWIGWYSAIEDLVDDLPETKFAPWQLARLPDELKTALYGSGGYDGNIVSAAAAEPTMTITANQNQLLLRAMCGGRVVSMTTRCLARFQTFPDWYELPANKTLAAKGIGNAVPPLLMKKVYHQLLDY